MICDDFGPFLAGVDPIVEPDAEALQRQPLDDGENFCRVVVAVAEEQIVLLALIGACITLHTRASVIRS